MAAVLPSRRAPALVLATLAVSSVPGAAPGQAPPDLDHGPHTAGFTVVEALDSTRAFRPLRDFRGSLAGETARPVQVSIWYPAAPAPDRPRMRAGEFRLLRASEVDFDVTLTDADSARLRARFIEQVVELGQDRSVATRTWDAETPAVRDARPLPGPHPTVLHFTGAGVSDPLLPAYLASHGFVVASFPSNGRMTEGSLEFTPNALTLDTNVDDAGFVYALLRRLPWADTRRLAVTSFSGGSLAALLWAMRDMQVSALVAVEGWERYRRGADILAGSVHYEPHRVRVPFLMLERAADEASPRYAKVPDVVEALRYAEVTRVAFRDASHGDFLSHASFGHTPRHAEIYASASRLIRGFLEATLGGDGGATRDLTALAAPRDDSLFTVSRSGAVGPVPTEEELYRLAETDPAAARAAYREAARIVPGSALFREEALKRAALFAPSAADSATIMRIVEDAYPAGSALSRGPLADADPGFLAISVSDLDTATAWYRDVLGLEPVRSVASPDGVLRARVMAAGPVVVELIHHRSTRAVTDVLDPGAHRFQLQGIVKAGLFVADAEALHEHLERRGVEVDPRIGSDPATGVRFFVFRDPDGNRIQVFERG